MISGKDFIGVGAGAHILNDKNQILLQKRNKECRNKAGYWTVPGGKVRTYEKVEETVVREIKEELGIDIKVLKLITVSNDVIKEEDQHWVSPQFLCKITNGKPVNLEPHKCEEIGWFDLDDVPDKLTNVTIDGLEKLRDSISQ